MKFRFTLLIALIGLVFSSTLSPTVTKAETATVKFEKFTKNYSFDVASLVVAQVNAIAYSYHNSLAILPETREFKHTLYVTYLDEPARRPDNRRINGILNERKKKQAQSNLLTS